MSETQTVPQERMIPMFYGHLDSAIGDVVRIRPGILGEFETVLVTCVDSLREIATAKVGREIITRVPACTVAGDALLLPGALVSDIDQAVGLFTGFDEVWCFRGPPPSVMPERVTVLPPPRFEPGTIPADVMEFMVASGCVLALGDGFGMNYVTPDRRIERELQELSHRDQR